MEFYKIQLISEMNVPFLWDMLLYEFFFIHLLYVEEDIYLLENIYFQHL